ncbi:MAG: hypothetical protein AAGD12_03600 [Pseudomonadota bacterium]
MTAMDEAAPADAIAPAAIDAADDMPTPAHAAPVVGPPAEPDAEPDAGPDVGPADGPADGPEADGGDPDAGPEDGQDGAQADQAGPADAAHADPQDAPEALPDDAVSAAALSEDAEPDDAGPEAEADATSDDPAAEPALHVLPARLALREAQHLLDELADSDPDAPRSFDAQAVAEISTGFALVLASLLRARSPEAAKIRLIRPSPAFVDAFSDLGLFQDLMKMEFGQ